MKPAAKAYLSACYQCLGVPHHDKPRDNRQAGAENTRRAERLDGGCLLYRLDVERRHKRNRNG